MTLPRFTGEASLYRTAICYRLAATWDGGSKTDWGPAQFLRLPDGGGVGPIGGNGGPKGCQTRSVDTDTCASGCQKTCNFGGEITETCVSTSQCTPVSCGPCLLPTDGIRQKILANLPIDPATDLVFKQSCQQGSNSFTQDCEICSQETRIGLPIVSDKCIKVCMRGFDPSSISVEVRDC
jgi:hypothetical protein